MKTYKLLLFLIVATLMSCNAQNEKNTAKIIELNEKYSFFYKFDEVALSELDKRVEITGDKSFEELKTSVSKEALDVKVITFFNNNFNSSEIEALYNQAKNFDNRNDVSIIDKSISETTIPQKTIPKISPELQEKKESLFRKLVEEGDEVFEDFKHQVYVLDSINYNSLKNDENREIKTEYKKNTPNGMYETTSFESNYQDPDAFMKSIEVTDQPGVDFNTIEKVSIEPTQYINFEYYINIVFNDEGAEQLRILTEANLDKPLPIIIGNEIIIAPYVNMPIEGGKLQISGGQMDYVIARAIADNIREELK